MSDKIDLMHDEPEMSRDFDVAVEVADRQRAADAKRDGIRLPPGFAAAARDLARGAFDVARIGPHDPLLVRMKPTPELAKRLADGSAKLIERDGGTFLGIARDVDSKRFAGNVALERVGDARGIKRARAGASAAFVWQALAVATQQHYLVEMSAGLAAIQAVVDELGLDGERDDDAELSTAMRELSRIERHIETGARTTPADRALAEGTFAAAERIADARLCKVDALLPSDDDPQRTLDAPKIMRQLVLAKRALAVSARAASILTRLPDEDAQRAINDLEHYSNRFEELRLRVNGATFALRDLVEHAEDLWAQHRRARANLVNNVRKLHNPLQSVAAAPVVGAGYAAGRKTVRKLARRDDTPAPRASFKTVDLRRLRAPKSTPRLAEPHRALVDEWAASAAGEAPIAVEVLVHGDDVRLVGSGSAEDV